MCSKETKRPCVDASATGEYVAGIEDLVLQILLWLPAKSVIRFKLVSKHWKSLISDPNFVQSHVLKGNPNTIIPLGMFVDVGTSQQTDFFWLSASDQEQTRYRAGPSLDFIDKAFLKLDCVFRIVSSCHGLLLCCSKYYSTSCPLCVCNPTTRKYRFIPKPKSYGWSISGLGFGFDPSVSPHYKIICVTMFGRQAQARDPGGIGSWNFEAEVYSSEDHRWRLLLQFNDSFMVYNSNGMYWNGGIHWVSEHSFHFDMITESLVKRRQPCCPQTLDGSDLRNIHMGDRYSYAFSISYVKLYVFELNVANYKWVLKNSVHVCDLTEAYPEIVTKKRYDGCRELNYEVSAIGVVEGVKEMDSTLLLAIPNKIISYRFSDKAMKTVYELPAWKGRSKELIYVRTYPFIETLSTV